MRVERAKPRDERPRELEERDGGYSDRGVGRHADGPGPSASETRRRRRRRSSLARGDERPTTAARATRR